MISIDLDLSDASDDDSCIKPARMKTKLSMKQEKSLDHLYDGHYLSMIEGERSKLKLVLLLYAKTAYGESRDSASSASANKRMYEIIEDLPTEEAKGFLEKFSSSAKNKGEDIKHWLLHQMMKTIPKLDEFAQQANLKHRLVAPPFLTPSHANSLTVTDPTRGDRQLTRLAEFIASTDINSQIGSAIAFEEASHPMRSFLKPLNSLVEDSNIVQTKYDELDETARSEGIWSYASHHDENHRTTKLYHAAVLAVLLRMGSVLTDLAKTKYKSALTKVFNPSEKKQGEKRNRKGFSSKTKSVKTNEDHDDDNNNDNDELEDVTKQKPDHADNPSSVLCDLLHGLNELLNSGRDEHDSTFQLQKKAYEFAIQNEFNRPSA